MPEPQQKDEATVKLNLEKIYKTKVELVIKIYKKIQEQTRLAN